MPERIKRECRKIGCHNLTSNANGYCDDHRAEAFAYDKKRLSSYQRGYDRKWQKYRRWFLAGHPLCARCGAIATVVDHIKPHKGDKQLFWDENNHQPLCKICHDRKTALEDGAFGNRVGGKNP